MRPRASVHEGLSRVARMDRHAEHEIHSVGGRDGVGHGCLGVERDTDAEPERTRGGHGTRWVVAGLDVERDAVSTGARDRLEVPLGLGDHQMAVELRPQPRTNGEMDASTIGPTVTSGMKWPSPTSKWKTFAPAPYSASSCAPRREKSDA